MGVQSLAQERAKHAWEGVEAAKRSLGGEFDKRFGDQAKKMPMRIRAAGLAQTLAFMRAKKQGEEVRRILEGWVATVMPAGPGVPKTLIERCVKQDSGFLRRATAEALAYLEWVVRFADAPKEGK